MFTNGASTHPQSHNFSRRLCTNEVVYKYHGYGLQPRLGGPSLSEHGHPNDCLPTCEPVYHMAYRKVADLNSYCHSTFASVP
ncbi:hypothetical protein PHET_08896 [Paragonimus heterotremus]|uniref:Uncharacterized protein n=1 Tax=Paragonimus heterotremus TaxID=100268 RepID=A0A8J4T3B4_9TREM|nr:hypothetical protein PHET_08896 [Paragonimus heterotremus]